MFVGYINRSGSTQQVVEEFGRQGIFLVKIRPMGANLVLLEDGEGRATEDLIAYEREWLESRFDMMKEWMESWFDKTKEWIPTKVSNESGIFSDLHTSKYLFWE